ncbi:uncharacterized protein LOC117639338 [Thrips palmi]|uniref:Uncharacterized protein LOC117639338 n=1 Tax=Thrips palmi TaxID=161013 RepID=A0A6P8Y3Z3_THRPL|nr:uncharacterized protein LOC117639338 [Thrips palmi]
MSWRRATALLVLVGVLPLLLPLLGAATASAAPSLSADGAGGPGAARAARARAVAGGGGASGVVPRMRRFPFLLPQVPLDVLDDDEESLFEANKRQMSDDYGHMRFGKRGGENDFAEYGHMRFGRAAA